jgi:hypothetical protein
MEVAGRSTRHGRLGPAPQVPGARVEHDEGSLHPRLPARSPAQGPLGMRECGAWGGVDVGSRRGSPQRLAIPSPTGAYERLIHTLGVCRRSIGAGAGSVDAADLSRPGPPGWVGGGLVTGLEELARESRSGKSDLSNSPSLANARVGELVVSRETSSDAAPSAVRSTGPPPLGRNHCIG